MASTTRSRSGSSPKKSGGKKSAAKEPGAKKRAPAKAGARRKPSVEPKGRQARAEAKRRERLDKMRSKSGNRYRIHYDIDGPRVRLGLLWFFGAMAAMVAGRLGVTLYFGVAFAAAASHCLRTWRARGHAVDPRIALVVTAFVVLCALVGPQLMGIGVLTLAGAAIASGAGNRAGGEGGSAIVAHAGLVLQSTLPAALAGGCLVLLAELELWAVISLVVLASAYETGDYLIGSGSANAAEGPIAGGAAVFVTALAIAALGVPPFQVGEALVLGALVAPMAFGGQLLASAMLPHSRAFAPALRRVDSLLIAAPVWYASIDLFVL